MISFELEQNSWNIPIQFFFSFYKQLIYSKTYYLWYFIARNNFQTKILKETFSYYRATNQLEPKNTMLIQSQKTKTQFPNSIKWKKHPNRLLTHLVREWTWKASLYHDSNRTVSHQAKSPYNELKSTTTTTKNPLIQKRKEKETQFLENHEKHKTIIKKTKYPTFDLVAIFRCVPVLTFFQKLLLQPLFTDLLLFTDFENGRSVVWEIEIVVHVHHLVSPSRHFEVLIHFEKTKEIWDKK